MNPSAKSTGIGRRIVESVEKFIVSDYEGALIAVSIAVDATAQKIYGPGVGKSYKKFLEENFKLITRVAFGQLAFQKFLISYEHPKIKSDAEGMCSGEEILYHAVRCGLLHEAQLPSNLRIEAEQTDKEDPRIVNIRFRDDEGNLILPAGLINGLIFGVLLAPENSAEFCETDRAVNIRGLQIPLNKVWGKRDVYVRLLEAIDAMLA